MAVLTKMSIRCSFVVHICADLEKNEKKAGQDFQLKIKNKQKTNNQAWAPRFSKYIFDCSVSFVSFVNE